MRMAEGRKWDIFISHAGEDKATVARPLAQVLRMSGLRIWVDESELRLGDSLRRKIDEGLAFSRFGVVILSSAFLSKEWPQKELNGLAARETASEKIILPVWHGIDHDVIARYSPMLADRVGISTAMGVGSVATAILQVVRGDTGAQARYGMPYSEARADFEKTYFTEMVEKYGSAARIAKEANLDRKTVYAYMDRHNLRQRLGLGDRDENKKRDPPTGPAIAGRKEDGPECAPPILIESPRGAQAVIDYDAFGAATLADDTLWRLLETDLPSLWVEEYKLMTRRPTNIIEVNLEPFTYLFDFYSDPLREKELAADPAIGDRVVVAFGLSRPHEIVREASRIRGWIGPTGEFLGGDRDKGHFIAHSIGGKADMHEINLFSQLRHINRGWSVAGKRYRSMECYCADNPGTYCFSRPLYIDKGSVPHKLEFGLLRRGTRTFWVEEFEN